MAIERVQDTNPEKGKRVSLLNGLVKRGIETNDCIGLHATSTEAFKAFVETGEFPGWSLPSDKDPNLPQARDLYFYPFRESFPDRLNFLPKEECKVVAQQNAARRGKTHRLLNKLGIPIDQSEVHPAAKEFFLFPTSFVHPTPENPDYFKDPEYPEYERFMKLRPRPEMERLIADAEKAKGVIAGINHTVLSHWELRPGDQGNDLRINMGEVSPKVAFSGIKPMGEIEIAYFRSLKEIK
ncbi:MAG TPA: hypothetical protein VE090_05960 [Methylomirabilota bacterium]|nr:hypothetical protein [Methylomirabilota bacterium]